MCSKPLDKSSLEKNSSNNDSNNSLKVMNSKTTSKSVPEFKESFTNPPSQTTSERTFKNQKATSTTASNITITLPSKSPNQQKKIIVIRKDGNKTVSDKHIPTKEYPKNDFNDEDYDFDDEEEKYKIMHKIKQNNNRFEDHDRNRDRNHQNERERERDKDRKWEDFIPIEEAKRKIEKGELFEGFVRVNPYNRRQIYLTSQGFEKDILVEGQVVKKKFPLFFFYFYLFYFCFYFFRTKIE